MPTRRHHEIHLRHAEGAPEAVISAVKTERELQRLIDGKGEVDQSQISEVVKKLQVVIADYLESGHGIDIRLTPLEILSAMEAAIQEASGKPSPWPDGADARTFFIHGLYDELIQQPSNIFETKLFPDGSTRYVPIARAVWKACLERLRDQIITGSQKMAQKKGSSRYRPDSSLAGRHEPWDRPSIRRTKKLALELSATSSLNLQ